MPYFFTLYFWLLMLSKTPFGNIDRSNRLLKEAESAYVQKNYIVALVKYRYLYHALHLKEKHIQLNLAHCYFANKDTAQAKKHYLPFAEDKSTPIRAIACQQLGLLAFRQHQYESALSYFKQALQAAPSNDTIRYNYELAKRLERVAKKTEPGKTKETEKTPEDMPPPPLQTPEELAQDSEKENKAQEKDQEAKAIQERLKRINLSQQKAEMILEALKNNEIQYIQQRKHTSQSNQEKMYPDW
ncbi:tetratricopeptide repeat protein [Rhodocytophaga rosea]|uniref:Tetratricopeptide repeat protein n=1 Tax=Rhodocytophaga rosea TaxID=2704465 RepID=A0A6C0GNY0_9BACT|nr:tetratricopeptide repeat protein [Rhodocytophaga rosea]QHT69761.1 tetratricopeptide repeat protein [Rhodocytophaga rosea]